MWFPYGWSQFYSERITKKTWRESSRLRRPEYVVGRVVLENVVTVPGQSPSERSWSTRRWRSYSSGRCLFNDLFGKSLNKCVWTLEGIPLGTSLPLFWLFKKLPRTSWYVCSHKYRISRSVVKLLRFKKNISNYGNVYLDMINNFSDYFFIWNKFVSSVGTYRGL